MGRHSNEQIGREAVDLANQIEALCRGRPTASVYIALSMMLGHSAAMAKRPDFEHMMVLVERGALDAFRRALDKKAEER